MRTHHLTKKFVAAVGLTAIALTWQALGAAPLTRRSAQREGGMPRATPSSVGMSDQGLQQATALLRQYVADRKISGAVAAVARRGKIVYFEPVGLQALNQFTAPMTERSLFRIYSMTKAVTAVGVMMLVEEGRLRLSDPASQYLPEFKNAMV